MNAAPVVISAAVEGSVDEAVARRLVRHVGGQPGAVYGKVHPAGLSRCIGSMRRVAGRDNRERCPSPCRWR